MHLISKLFAFHCSLVLIASAAHAQPEIICKPADIQGRIDDEAGKPVAGAKVLVLNAPLGQDLFWYTTRPEENRLLGEATSDVDGKYRIEWRVKRVSAIKNTSVDADILVIKPNFAIGFKGASLWFENYIPFTLRPEVEHIGKVLDDQRKPLADAEVLLDAIYSDVKSVDRGKVFSTEGVCSLLTDSLRPRARTDKDGIYRLRGLASGQIALLQVTHPKFPSIRRMQPVDGQSPESIKEHTRDIDPFAPWYNNYRKPLQMLPGILGNVVAIEEGTGKRLADIEVCRRYAAQSTKSDQEGILEYWLPESHGFPRSYCTRCGNEKWSAASITLKEGDAPAELLVPIRRTITGHVRDQETSKGIEGVGVYLSGSSNAEFDQTFTDDDGKYCLTTSQQTTTVYLSGPKLSYVLPVAPWSTAVDEPSMEIDSTLHQRNIRFQFEQLIAEADFAIPKYPKKRVRVIDRNGQPVRGTQVKLGPNITMLPRPITAKSNEDGIVEFELDRPINKSTAWVANADGIGVAAITGMTDEVLTLTIEPTIAIPGLLTAKASDGTLRNAAGIPIFLKAENSNDFAQMDLATSDQNGRFTVYLPHAEGLRAKLFVNSINETSKYDWEVELNGSARADFVMDDDRVP